MHQPIVYVDTSTIQTGKREELESAMKHLSGFVEQNVPRVLSYGFYFDEIGQTMTVVAVHPDSDALEFHLEVGGPEFRRFSDLINLDRIEVYGKVDESVVERLHRKARMLGSGTVTVHGLHVGFTRV